MFELTSYLEWGGIHNPLTKVGLSLVLFSPHFFEFYRGGRKVRFFSHFKFSNSFPFHKVWRKEIVNIIKDIWMSETLLKTNYFVEDNQNLRYNVVLHHSAFGLIVQCLSWFKNKLNIRDFKFLHVSFSHSTSVVWWHLCVLSGYINLDQCRYKKFHFIGLPLYLIRFKNCVVDIKSDSFNFCFTDLHHYEEVSILRSAELPVCDRSVIKAGLC